MDGDDAGRPRVVAFNVDGPVADDDPLRAVKLRARELSSPHHLAGQSAARLAELAALFADRSFAVDETAAAARAAGFSEADIDAAAWVALAVRDAEAGGSGAG